MKVVELLDGLVVEPLSFDIELKGLALDSRQLKSGFAFIAIAGATQHGLEHMQQAESKGAVVIVYDPLESAGYEMGQVGIESVAVTDLSQKLGIIAHRFYQAPSEQMDVIGVTGTNGKTTCSQFLLQMLPQCGVIGTLGWGGKDGLNETVNTTPDAVVIQQILAEFVREGKTTAVMEVSSHGLEQGRVNAIRFKGAIFTNLSRDHLDYHGSMADYLQAKLSLFNRAELQFAVVNADDENSGRFLAVTQKYVKQWAFSATGKQLEQTENLTAENVEISLNGIAFTACWNKERVFVKSSIVGRFNLENILAVMTGLLALGYSLQHVAQGVAELKPVKGRMESLGGDGKPFVFVDYAHTPDALEKVLQELKQYSRLKLIFGCGGDRDKGKRKEMAEIAELLADEVVITNDNPRNESPEQIINDIVLGFKNKDVEVIPDRRQAISTVISKADKGDCIVVAGKGHESYQEIKGVKHSFSDQGVVRQALLEWAE